MANKPPKSVYVYDVFVSYRWVEPDQSWVRRQLVPALKMAGLRVCLDIHDFVPGHDVIREMTRAGRESHRAVCILSPDYVDGNHFVDFESLMFVRRDPGGVEGLLIPILLRPCGVPEWIRGLVPLDWTRPDDRPGEWHRLLRALGAPTVDSPAPGGIEEAPFVGLGPEIPLTFDVEEASRRVQEAADPDERAAVVAELIAEMKRRDDPTERYWIYAALGQIGGESAVAALSRGLSDPNAFAREGASRALAEVNQPESRSPPGRSARWLLVCLCFAVVLVAATRVWRQGEPAASKPAESASHSMHDPPVLSLEWTEPSHVRIVLIGSDGQKWEVQVCIPTDDVAGRVIVGRL